MTKCLYSQMMTKKEIIIIKGTEITILQRGRIQPLWIEAGSNAFTMSPKITTYNA